MGAHLPLALLINITTESVITDSAQIQWRNAAR